MLQARPASLLAAFRKARKRGCARNSAAGETLPKYVGSPTAGGLQPSAAAPEAGGSHAQAFNFNFLCFIFCFCAAM